MHDLLARRAALSPHSIALKFDGQCMTYAELDVQSNRLSHYLRIRGVGPEHIVALCMHRGPALIVGLFGILKAGAAYLPLDPMYPADRLQYMLRDADAKVVLTESSLLAAVAEWSEDRSLLTFESDTIGEYDSQPLPERVEPTNLAYVIYTSGSAGRPKGVAVTHAGLANCADALVLQLALNQRDCVLQFSSMSFDGSVFEILAAVGSGATLCMARMEALTPGPTLLRTLRSQDITAAILVSSVLATLTPEVLPALRTLIVGAEPCPAWLVPLWAPGRGMWNTYGTTETTVWSTFFRAATVHDASASVPIGRPIANVELYVLDDDRQLVPPGSPGELYIGGVGVARGYLNRPSLTADAFVPHPFTTRSGARLYRTGDLVRQLPSGDLAFLGRRDGQVKLRGLRIELGEIEAAIAALPGVSGCVATLHTDASRGDRLVAYVHTTAGVQRTPVDWHRALARSLPAHMIPTAFVPLSSLPLGPNGKVNRRALPPFEAAPRVVAASADAHTRLEKTLVTTWEQVLDVHPIGVDDDFFALGGDSMAAARIAATVRQGLDVDLSVERILASRTVRQLASALQRLPSPARRARPSTEIDSAQESPLRMLSFAQERLWFLSQLAPYHFLTIPLALRLRGALDLAALRAALRDVVRRHEPLRTVFPVFDGVPAQRVMPPSHFAFDVVDASRLAAEPDAALTSVLFTYFHDPIDTSTGPLFRARVLRLAPTHHVLAMAIHHIAADRWSVERLLAELATWYDGYVRGDPTPVPLQSVRYADHAVWERQRLARHDVSGAAREYWRERLSGAPTVALPTDYPRPSTPAFRGALCQHGLDPSLVSRLREVAAREQMTLFMLLLAPLYLLLARRSGQEDLVIGTLSAGRHRRDTDPLVGLFVNPLALRTSLSGDPGVTDFLRRIRATCLGAFAHDGVPFQHVVQHVGPPRDASREPVFQVALVLQNTPDVGFAFHGLDVEAVPIPHTTSHFDLTFYCRELENGGLSVLLEYDTALFTATTAGAIATEFRSIAAALCADTSARLSEVIARCALPRGPTAGQRSVVDAGGIALPMSPEEASPEEASPDEPPGEVTMELLAIWHEVLDVTNAGIHDNFFTAGGHSLAAVQFCARVESRIGVRLPVRALFEAPTVAGLARWLRVPARSNRGDPIQRHHRQHG